MHNLQKINLAGNEIEHIPVWFGKKLRCLNILNLRQNKIYSLQDVSRLKPLKDLTSLFLADNPIANLPHYRLYIVFHLRSLNTLDGQPITNKERQEAHDRFNIEEVEKLERDLEKKLSEIEELQNQKAKILSELQNQDEVNRSLKQETVQQKKSYKELEREMDTKNEILKQKTMELTRACQKQYELEQELAFYKIDAKFEPMGYFTSEDLEVQEGPEESPYIGKARYKRNLYAQEGFIADRAQQMQVGKIERDEDDQIRNQQVRARIHTTLDVELNDKEKNIQAAQVRLTELRQEIMNAEEQILKATGELKDLEDAVAQKKISEAEKERLRQQLSSKIQLLNQLRLEAQELEKQMEWQRGEMDKKKREIDELQKYLDSLNPNDPRHSHVKSQKAGKEQQLDMMNRQYKELEGRLDEMLSRIAKETEEIKDLEQQLTEGQIAANEALKRDLEGIISGLQEYLESIKGQAKQAHDECRELQAERETLLQRLAELEEERNQLEIVAMDAENMKKEIAELERSLQEQQVLNESLRQAQGDLSEYEAELEAQLKVRDAEANQLKEELERRRKLSHMENSALQAELEKDKQALENALTKAQLLEEREKDNKRLLSQLKQLQGDNDSLKEKLQNLQSQLDNAMDNLIHPEQIAARVSELKRKLQTGVGEVRCNSPSDVLGQSLSELQKQINEILAKFQEEKREAQERQRKLQEEIAVLQEKARDAPGDYKRACNKAAEAKMQSEKRQYEAKVRQLENEVRKLNEKLKNMEESQGLADQQLVEADEEREKLLMELQDLENQRKMEDARAQKQLLGLNKELKELKRAVAMSDKMATSELSNAKEQLKSLHGTVLKINQERTEEMQEAENFCSQAAQAARDLAKAEAEIELLQNLLKEREKQLHEEMQNADAGITTSNLQQLEIDKLNDTMRKQRADIERLKHLLDHARADNIGEIESLLDEIESLRHTLSHQNDYISSVTDPFRRKGYWYYVPSPSNMSGPDSLSTKDSGLGLHYPMTSSPARRKGGRMRHNRREARGHWVYSPFRHVPHRWHNNRDDGEDGEAGSEASVPPACHFVPPPGSVIYTVLPDGAPAPQGTVVYGPPPPSIGRPVASGTVIYGPPPSGTQTVYGPPPPHFTIPVIPAGVLHCNVSTHHNLENEITHLEDIVDQLKSRRHKEKKAKERLQEDIEDLEHQKDALRKEVEGLRASSQKRKRKDFVEGHIDTLITELELEKSLQHHDDIMDEIQCIEKTLLKRRAELREADRLLAEAETELQSTRAKTADTIQKYDDAKKHLSQTENDAEELERRAQETAKQLVKADQQLRILQANARDLEQHRVEQENILKEINSVVSAKDEEFHSLSRKIEKLTNNLQKLQADIQVAEGKEDHHLQTLKEAENILQEKKVVLERLNDQVSVQQQEIMDLDRHLGQKKEELHLLQNHIDQKKADLKEVLRDGELDVADRRQEIKDVKSVLEDLSVQKGELSAQLSEKRAQLVIVKQEVAQEEENLQKVTIQINKQKSELKHVLEMLQLENNELQGLKLQHDQKVNEMEKTQCTLLETKLELENLQRISQRMRGEVEWQKQLLEKDHREIELLMTQMHSLQESVASLSSEKEHLEEISQDLEKKLAQANKVLSATESSNKAATCNLEKLESDNKILQKDIDLLNKEKQTGKQEMAAVQQLLQEKKEELSLLNDEIADSRDQLKLIEQDLRNTTKQRDELLREQCALKGGIDECMGRYKLLQEKEGRKEQQLRHWQRAITEKQNELEKQETLLQQIQKDAECQGEQLKDATSKLKEHKQTLEWELANRQDALEMVTSRVKALEERALKLQQEEKWSAALEESLASTRQQLSEKEQELREKSSELLALQKEMEVCKADRSRLHEQLTSQRKKEEKRILVLKEAIKSQRTQFEQTAEEQKHEKCSLQKQFASVEQAAYDNHERAKRLMNELRQLQAEHMALRKQLRTQEELDKRQQEVNEAVKALKYHVKKELKNSFTDLHCAGNDLLEDVEAVLQENESLQSQLESLKENFPFTANEASQTSDKDRLTRVHIRDEHWRGEALREKLQQHEDRLKAQLHHRMSKQADVLSKGRQQTEGSLHSLKRQVDALDELVSNTSGESPFHSHNSSGANPSHEDVRINLSQSFLPGIKISHITETFGIPVQQPVFNSTYTHGIHP
ncbi:centriolin-like [Rhinophrynus dorsalis]